MHYPKVPGIVSKTLTLSCIIKAPRLELKEEASKEQTEKVSQLLPPNEEEEKVPLQPILPNENSVTKSKTSKGKIRGKLTD